MSAIEALYIFDEHNTLLFSHIYTGRPPPPSTLLSLFLQQKAPRPSVIYLPSLSPPTLCYSIIQDNLLFLSPCSTPVEPLLVLEFLHRVVDALQEFLGSPLLATKITSSYDVVSQIIAEIADGGVVCQTEANALRDVVETGPGVLKNLLGSLGASASSPALQGGGGGPGAIAASLRQPQLQPAQTSQGSAIPWRRSNVRHTSNELYVDFVESLSVTVAPSGRPLSAYSQGSIIFTSKVSGVPDLVLNLQTDGRGAGMGSKGDQLQRVMERVVFHPCVRLNRWKSEGCLSFVPPDGRFALCGYEVDLLGAEAPLTVSDARTKSALNLPAMIDVATGLGTNALEFEVRLSQPARSAAAASLKSNLVSGRAKVGLLPGDAVTPVGFEDLTVHIPIPPGVRNVPDIRPSRGEAHWNPAEGVVEWNINPKDFGPSGAVLRCTVQGPLANEDEDLSTGVMNGMTATTYEYEDDGSASERPTITKRPTSGGANGSSTDIQRQRNRELMPTSATLSFSMKGWLPSGIKVESLAIDTKKSRGLGHDIKPYKGVKYLTTPGCSTTEFAAVLTQRTKDSERLRTQKQSAQHAMLANGQATGVKDAYARVDYDLHPQWRYKLLTPAQLLVHDIQIEHIRKTGQPRLEVLERASSSIFPSDRIADIAPDRQRATNAASNPIEEQRFLNLEEQYGWMRRLRLEDAQLDNIDKHSNRPDRCRWIHCYSKFEEYLKGVLWALYDDCESVAECIRLLDSVIEHNTRFSKHGKYFNAFSAPLRKNPANNEVKPYPMLMSVPFLDWSMQGSTPPLRFQVDKREGFRSSKSSAHMLRSVLQYFYRLEDTADREQSQVFAKHKPWSTDRDLDLRVRQWYGHYPTALNVDELWVLVIDDEHIVTFSSNQTWKSRTPPLQLTSRISDISFRGIRNAYFPSYREDNFTAMTHAIVALNGALGLMHRQFWGDFVLPATDRYAGHLSHLQYRLHRAPNSKLVMDLMACQEELGVVIQITVQQIEMIGDLLETWRRMGNEVDGRSATPRRTRESFTKLLGPTTQLLDNLQRELTDLRELRDNTDHLVTRTIQLVNIRLEDHGKAILVFTVVTIIFLPLNFVSSFFGMNVSDIRNLRQGQWIFWAVALCVTVGVVGGSLFLAFSGGDLWQKFVVWRDQRKELHLSSTTTSRQRARQETDTTNGRFRVLGTTSRAGVFGS